MPSNLKLPDVNWELKLRFAAPAKPFPDVVEGSRWSRLIGGEAVVVEREGDSLVVFGEEGVAVKYLGLQDPKELYDFLENVPELRPLRKIRFGRAGFIAATVFEGIVKAIVQQQISFAVAAKVIARLVERFGERKSLGDMTLYDFPSPEVLARASFDEFRSCGLSGRKVETIREIASEALSCDLEELRRCEAEEVYEFLTSFRGVGRWTAELTMCMAMEFNIVPADDLGIRRAFKRLFGVDRPAEIRKIAEGFGSYARDVVFHLFILDRGWV